MTNLSQNTKNKIQQLFQWLRSHYTSPKQPLPESALLIYDVDVYEGFAAIFSDISSPDEIHTICKQFYESYISEDKNIKILVILLIPPMLQSYLVYFHSNIEQTKSSSTPIFTVGKPTSGLNALSFLLLQLYQLAPRCIRSTEQNSPDLPAYSDNSIYHNTLEFQTVPIVRAPSSTFISIKSGQCQKMSSDSNTSVVDTLCLLRIYTDCLIHQLTEGTSDQRSVVLASIRSFSLFVYRVVSLKAKPRIPLSPNFLTSLINSIDRILFLLNYDHDYLLSSSKEERVFTPSDATIQLRSQVFNLIGSIEQLASYHCFCQVILLASAVHSAWNFRFKHVFVRTHLTTSERHPKQISVEYASSGDSVAVSESSDSSDDKEPSLTMRPFNCPTKTSAITNASFRPEAVSEDIPISYQFQGHIHHRQLNLLHLSEKHLTRSSENVSSLGSLIDQDAKNVRRIKHGGKFGHHKF